MCVCVEACVGETFWHGTVMCPWCQTRECSVTLCSQSQLPSGTIVPLYTQHMNDSLMYTANKHKPKYAWFLFMPVKATSKVLKTNSDRGGKGRKTWKIGEEEETE